MPALIMQATLADDIVGSDLLGLFALALDCPVLSYTTSTRLAAAIPALVAKQQPYQEQQQQQQKAQKRLEQREQVQEQQQQQQDHQDHQQQWQQEQGEWHHHHQQQQVTQQHFTSLLTSAAARGHYLIAMELLNNFPCQASHLIPIELHTALQSLVRQPSSTSASTVLLVTSLCRLPGARQLEVGQVLGLLQQAVRRGHAAAVAALCELPVLPQPVPECISEMQTQQQVLELVLAAVLKGNSTILSSVYRIPAVQQVLIADSAQQVLLQSAVIRHGKHSFTVTA